MSSSSAYAALPTEVRLLILSHIFDGAYTPTRLVLQNVRRIRAIEAEKYLWDPILQSADENTIESIEMHLRRFAIRQQMSPEEKAYVKDLNAVRAVSRVF